MRSEFPIRVRVAAFLRAGGRCEICGAIPKIAHYDHIKPCAFDGDASLENCQLLCIPCHELKTGKQDVPAVAKSNRLRRRHAGIRPDRSIRAWRRMDGTPVYKPRER